MREEILIKHLKNLIFENEKIEDAFIMNIEGLLVTVLRNEEEYQKIAAVMAGIIDFARRMENKDPEALSFTITDKSIIAVPLSEKFYVVVLAEKYLNSFSVIRLIEKNRQNILGMIEKTDFNDLFSFRPVEVQGLDI